MEKKKLTAGKIICRILLGLLCLVLLVCACGAGFVLLGKEKTIAAPLTGVSLDTVADGTYEGSYRAFRWSNTVSVTVKDHRIVAIEQIKPQALAKPETILALIDRVLEAQNTNVDTVSGATADKKAFLSAVENALNP